MNTAQTIFTAFFGLYFAVTVTRTGGFHPFDTPAIYKGECNAIGRFVASFLLLNIAPVSYFVFVFHRLEAWSSFVVGFWVMVQLVVLSLAGFGFYRIFVGVMLLKYRARYLFFGNQPLPQDAVRKLGEPWRREVLPHLIPGLIWVAVTVGLAYCWTR
jgi:hypothetical protein